jgi:hypothetical protein
MYLHEPTILIYQPNCQRLFTPSKLSILPNLNTPYDGSWYVRNNGSEGGPTMYFPSVDSPERLMETLEIAWTTDWKERGPHDWRPIYLKSTRKLAMHTHIPILIKMIVFKLSKSFQILCIVIRLIIKKKFAYNYL